jgi:hypothetical protein
VPWGISAAPKISARVTHLGFLRLTGIVSSGIEEEIDEIVGAVTRSSRFRTAKGGWRLRGCVVGGGEEKSCKSGRSRRLIKGANVLYRTSVSSVQEAGGGFGVNDTVGIDWATKRPSPTPSTSF